MPTSEELLQSLGEEVKGLGESAEKKLREIESRLLLAEQRLDSHKFRGSDDGDFESPAQKLVTSEQFKSFQTNGLRSSGRINVGSFHQKTALINQVGQNQPLVPPVRGDLVGLQHQRLTVRNLLRSIPITGNLVEYAKEASFTNNAAPQYSLGAYENVVKAESAMAFTLANMPVSTLAHWIPISNQMLADAPAIQGFVSGELTYGLKLKEEDELLNGSGIQGHLSGLVTNATVFDTTPVATTTDQYYDILGLAIAQLQKENFSCTGFVLNPVDFWTMVRQKESGTGIASGLYLAGSPLQAPVAMAWGVPVVVTNSMAQGQFLAGDFAVAAAIWDRQDATVEISREHSDYFVRNLSALLCEERLALTVFRTKALIFGGWPFGS
jgi:HK97 family phage major capsid protein